LGTVGGIIYADGVTTTLAQALAKCPGGVLGCHIIVTANQTFTTGLTWSQSGSPLIIECTNGSGLNQNPQGTLLTFSPSSAPAAALLVTNNSRLIIRNCNLTQGNSQDGVSATLTNVVGNGTSATANCTATCSQFAAGQVVSITGNANAGFNNVFLIKSTNSNSFTFDSTVNATGANGSAIVGVSGIVIQGSQASSIENSQVYNFTGVQYQITDAAASSAEYNTCYASHFRGGRVALSLNQYNSTKSTSDNKFFSCTASSASIRQILTTGTASENAWYGGEQSDTAGTNATLVQFGDGVNSCRENDFYDVTMESPNTSPANQVGIDNRCQGAFFKWEGGLAGATPVPLQDAAAAPGGTCHWGYQTSSAGTFGLHWESTCKPLRFDGNGNIGLGNSAPIAGANPSINGAGGLALCNAGSCAAQVTATSLQILSGFSVSNLLASATAPTIAGAGCGGSAASIPNNNGTAAFEINVGTTPGSACTVTMPAAAHGWACSAVDVTTNSTSVFYQKQSPAGSQSATQIVITNFNDVAVATAFTASDVVRVSCYGY
jgi:hypothetical protein